MRHKFTVFFCALVLIQGLWFGMLGQSKFTQQWATPLAPQVSEPSDIATDYVKSPVAINDTVGEAVLAALLPNSFGTLLSWTGPIYSDPYSGVITIIHRGNRGNNNGETGQIWYAASVDSGATWFDVGSFNLVRDPNGRHPNIAISNPNKSTDPFDANLKPILSWISWVDDPLPSSGFLWLNILGSADQSVGFATPENRFLQPDTVFGMSTTANDETGAVYVTYVDIDTVTNGNIYFRRTEDQGANWEQQLVYSPETIDADSINGQKVVWSPDGTTGYILYQGVWSKSVDPTREFMWGYSKSTDSGATWSTPTPVPMSTIEGMPENYDFMSFYWDGIVNMNGDLHVLAYYSENGTADTGIFEVFWNGTNWELKNIETQVVGQWNLPDASGSALITQSEAELARSLAGDIIYAKWIDQPDTTELFPDVFVSARFVDGGEWGEPINVSQSPEIYEKMTRMSPRVTELNDGLGSALLHITYVIFGNGDTDELAESEAWYLRGVTVTPPQITGIEDNDGSQPQQFALHQNFPNPFNPTTTIAFSLQKSTEITLEVFSITGQKVATLVNGSKNAGEHKITFDASNLGSGVYFYKLSAGSFSETKKMVLMK